MGEGNKMVCCLGEDLSVAFYVWGARQAIGDLSQDSPDFTRHTQCLTEVRKPVPSEKQVLTSEPSILLSLFSFGFLGVATIAATGVAALMERSVVRGFPYFRGFVPRDGLCRILFPGLMVVSYVTELVSTLVCVMLGGSSPCTVGSSPETGAPSTLPWMKRLSEKKEFGVMLRAPTISFEGAVIGVVIGCAPTAMPVPEAPASLCLVIRVHALVGDVDMGVRHDRRAASVS